jgi:hypothetical protein
VEHRDGLDNDIQTEYGTEAEHSNVTVKLSAAMGLNTTMGWITVVGLGVEVEQFVKVKTDMKTGPRVWEG